MVIKKIFELFILRKLGVKKTKRGNKTVYKKDD